MNPSAIQKIEISHKTIIFTLVLVAVLWFLFQIKDILFLLFISFILMSALRPIVDKLSQFRIPRIVSVLFLYGVLFGLVGTALVGSIPTLVYQTTRFIYDIPGIAARILPYWRFDNQWLTQQIAPISENVVRVTVSIFSNVITTVTVLVFTFYFLLERNQIDRILSRLAGAEVSEHIMTVTGNIEERLGAWVLGQMSLMVFIGVLVFIGLTLLHINYALPLAILAGVLEIVPMIGPIFSAVPAVLVALTISPLLTLSVIALYFVIQQVENSLVVPFVMKRSVGLSPLVTIISLMIGGRLAGMQGVILSVPVVIVIQEVVRSFLASHTLKQSKEK